MKSILQYTKPLPAKANKEECHIVVHCLEAAKYFDALSGYMENVHIAGDSAGSFAST